MQNFIDRNAYHNDRLNGIRYRIEMLADRLGGPVPSNPEVAGLKAPENSALLPKLYAGFEATETHLDQIVQTLGRLENNLGLGEALDMKSAASVLGPNPGSVRYAC